MSDVFMFFLRVLGTMTITGVISLLMILLGGIWWSAMESIWK